LRTLGEKNHPVAETSPSNNSNLDLESIESAMKRVLSTQVPSASYPSAAPSVNNGGPDLSAALSEREAKISALQNELEKSKAEAAERAKHLEAKAAVAGSITTAGGEDPAVKVRIAELEARLAEYEVIEDDIADLSRFKEENSKLSTEVEDLRKQLSSLPIDNPPSTATEAKLKFEKADKFELDPNDEVMKEFAAAVEVQKAPPTQAESKVVEQPIAQQAIEAMFADPEVSAVDEAPLNPVPEEVENLVALDIAAPAIDTTPQITASEIAEIAGSSEIPAPVAAPPGPPSQPAAEVPPESPIAPVLNAQVDTDKMLTEVAGLSATGAAADENALDDVLDTNKLLAEAGSLEADPSAEDDLLAEFKAPGQ
jgi:hypothetical protein